MSWSTLSAEAKKTWKIIGVILLVLFILFLVWWFAIRGKVNMTEVKRLAAEEAKKYDKPVQVEEIILKGVNEILDDRNLWAQAKAMSAATGIPIEQVVVTAAISAAKQYQYI